MDLTREISSDITTGMVGGEIDFKGSSIIGGKWGIFGNISVVLPGKMDMETGGKTYALYRDDFSFLLGMRSDIGAAFHWNEEGACIGRIAPFISWYALWMSNKNASSSVGLLGIGADISGTAVVNRYFGFTFGTSLRYYFCGLSTVSVNGNEESKFSDSMDFNISPYLALTFMKHRERR